jgi:hypothetical protein
MNIEVHKLNDQLLQRLQQDGLAVPNACFQNCFATAVMFSAAVPGGISYVLCWLIDRYAQRHPHALIGIDGKYCDPTVQANPDVFKFVAKYQMEKVLSREEAVQIFELGGGRISQIEGGVEIEGIPPALFADGTIRCEIVNSL